MTTDEQVRKLFMLIQKEKTKEVAAMKAGMCVKTANKYLKSKALPSELKAVHDWRTREDPFENIWNEVEDFLGNNDGLEAKFLFEFFQREYPGEFMDGQLRTFQRRVKQWKALHGPAKEVFFAQIHYPGKLCQSDFTNMDSFGITINGKLFPHLIYHFVLTYSNWETGSICFSESFESLSDGLQKALWELGGVPENHQTDQLTSAVNNLNNPEEFTRSYQALLSHYKLNGKKIRVRKPNENGDVEQRHHRFKNAIKQRLILRGSCEFSSREEYEEFLKKLFKELNLNRQEKLKDELSKLKTLPLIKLNSCKIKRVRVGVGSTIRILHNVYSVNSRLIGEQIDVHIYSEYLEIWYGQKKVDKIPRLRGDKKHDINYRHIIDSLVKKPGAFENYRYKNDLFPSSNFRMAYDNLHQNISSFKADKEYLKILHLSAKESEEQVNNTLRYLLENNFKVSFELVEGIIRKGFKVPVLTDVKVLPLNLRIYDQLISGGEV